MIFISKKADKNQLIESEIYTNPSEILLSF